LRLQQEAGVAEREQALVQQSAQARAERLAAAHKRVELFASPATARSRIELFGVSPRPVNSNNARTTEEA